MCVFLALAELLRSFPWPNPTQTGLLTWHLGQTGGTNVGAGALEFWSWSCVNAWGFGGGLEKEESRSEWRHFVWFSVQQGTIWELQSLCKGQGRQSSNYCVGVCSRCSGISSWADSSLLPSLRPKYLWSTYLVRKRIIGIMHCEGQLWHISYIISCSYLSPEKVLSHLSLFPHCVIR